MSQGTRDRSGRGRVVGLLVGTVAGAAVMRMTG